MGAFIVGNAQKYAVKLLFQGKKVREVAAIMGVHRTTLWRWFQHPELQTYAARYCESERRKIIEAPYYGELFDLNNPDPFKALEAAKRALDLGEMLML